MEERRDSRFSHLIAHDFVYNPAYEITADWANKLLLYMLVTYLLGLIVSFILILVSTITNLPSTSYKTEKWLSENRKELTEYNLQNQEDSVIDEKMRKIQQHWEDTASTTVAMLNLKYACLVFATLLGILFTINKNFYGIVVFLIIFIASNFTLEIFFSLNCKDTLLCTIDVKETRVWQMVIRGIRFLFFILIFVVTVILIIEMRKVQNRKPGYAKKKNKTSTEALERTESGRLQLPSKRRPNLDQSQIPPSNPNLPQPLIRPGISQRIDLNNTK